MQQFFPVGWKTTDMPESVLCIYTGTVSFSLHREENLGSERMILYYHDTQLPCPEPGFEEHGFIAWIWSHVYWVLTKFFHLDFYCILPCIMHTHIFVCITYGIIMPILYPWYVLIIPRYNANPYFSLKNLGKRCALYMAKYGNFKPPMPSQQRSK